MLRRSGGRAVVRDPRRVRLLALMGVVSCAVVLPFAVASAGQVGERGGAAGLRAVSSAGAVPPGSAGRPPEAWSRPRGDDKLPSAAPGESPLLLGLGLATATRCGPEVSSPDGVEAQTCVLTQGADTWARTYYRNTTGEPLDADLTLMGPGDRTVRMRCAVDGDDEPETCDTPREHTRGMPADYSAVSEFAGRGEGGPMLLRSGSGTGDVGGRGTGDAPGRGVSDDSDANRSGNSAAGAGS
ncbi:hypothetical protein ACF1B0_11365 [Streptomyces anandii]|uniref:hypothetical protein n=1 Tax=Streptomyces anandii TaxID=285454 RepID=UPI003702C83F